MFKDEQLDFFVEQGRAWAALMHSELHPLGLPLRPPLIDSLKPFVQGGALERIRVVPVPAIPNPPFYAQLHAQGLRVPLDFAEMSGLTFLDTILISQSRPVLDDAAFTGLLFHESVHVVQYQYLGTDRFMFEYVHGWARNGYEYRLIPLEEQAFALQDRFMSAPSVPFSVHDEVKNTWGPGAAA
jgi:hypothetical protein